MFVFCWTSHVNFAELLWNMFLFLQRQNYGSSTSIRKSPIYLNILSWNFRSKMGTTSTLRSIRKYLPLYFRHIDAYASLFPLFYTRPIMKIRTTPCSGSPRSWKPNQYRRKCLKIWTMKRKEWMWSTPRWYLSATFHLRLNLCTFNLLLFADWELHSNRGWWEVVGEICTRSFRDTFHCVGGLC